MRWVVALMFLSACDVVFGIDQRPVRDPEESTTNDEDGDEIVDADDPCPHLAMLADEDSDKDNIGDLCDPRPDTEDKRYFFALLGGDLGRFTVVNGLLGPGAAAGDADAVVLGAVATDERSTLVFDIDTDRADVSVGVTVLGAGLDAELGAYAVHRAFDDMKTQRGDNCLVGRDSMMPPNFLEVNLDNEDGPTTRFQGQLGNASGSIQLSRRAEDLRCAFSSDIFSSATLTTPTTPRTVVGDIAVSGLHVRALVHWVWVVVPRPQ